jgi:hypothetical protein
MKNIGSLHEVVHPLLYCACLDMGLQPMIGLWLRSRRVKIGSLVAPHCIILDFLIFRIYYVLIRFYEIYFTLFCFPGFCGLPKRSPPTSTPSLWFQPHGDWLPLKIERVTRLIHVQGGV